MLTTTQRLTALQNRATRYEVTISNGTETRLLGYTPKSRDAILRLVRQYPEAIISLTGETEVTAIRGGLRAGAWTITHSGRTQREAIIEGEVTAI